MNKHLLIIEDSKQIAAVIQRIAVSTGYCVTIAHTFADVKKLLEKEHNFGLATVDYSLPDALDGEVIPFVIENDIPSIVMTGRMDDKTRKKILNLPVVDYITKENAQAYHYLLRTLKNHQTNKSIGVLVVDDSLTARNQVASLLKRRNFKVYTVPDGPKALSVLEERTDIKIVITDQEMPGMDGIELIQKIRRNHDKHELIIIGLSGADKNYQSARFIKSGADDFLRKPFCPEEFSCRIMQNVEKLQYLNEIEQAANNDYLTNLYNRRYFVQHADKLIKNASIDNTNYILLILYIDNFKSINDKYGHDIGDELLKIFSKEMEKHFNNDLLARFGGAEFGLLYSDTDNQDIEQKISALKVSFKEQLTANKKISCTASFSCGGVIVDDSQHINELLKIADDALHIATDKGADNLEISGYINID